MGVSQRTADNGRATRHAQLQITLFAVDALMLLLATLLATWVRFSRLDAMAGLENVRFEQPLYSEISLFAVLVWLVFLWQGQLYDLGRLFWGSGEFSRVLRAISFGLVGIILLTYVLKLPGLSRAWTLLAWGLSVAFVSAGRLGVRIAMRELRRRGRLRRPTVVVGSNREAEDLIRVLRSDRSNGIDIVGCLASTEADYRRLQSCAPDVPVLGSARKLMQVIAEKHIDTVVIASTAFEHEVIARIMHELRGVEVDVHISSGLFEVLTSRVIVREVSGVPLITVKGISLSRWSQFRKRVFDLVVAGAIILLGMPIWVFVMLAIKFDSRGPVFYKQPRVGRAGEAFGMYKFRSMCDDADARLAQLLEDNEADGPLFKIKNDPRVTRVGKWMRKFSVDEFPQLLNVMRGEMSLVGPRPPLIHEAEQYTDHHWRRMEVLPGMTGLWQVSGRSRLSFEEMVRLDVFYIENWSLGFDLAILARTLPAVLFARGAY